MDDDVSGSQGYGLRAATDGDYGERQPDGEPFSPWGPSPQVVDQIFNSR
jgi:hypothetical protein